MGGSAAPSPRECHAAFGSAWVARRGARCEVKAMYTFCSQLAMFFLCSSQPRPETKRPPPGGLAFQRQWLYGLGPSSAPGKQRAHQRAPGRANPTASQSGRGPDIAAGNRVDQGEKVLGALTRPKRLPQAAFMPRVKAKAPSEEGDGRVSIGESSRVRAAKAAPRMGEGEGFSRSNACAGLDGHRWKLFLDSAQLLFGSRAFKMSKLR